MNIRWTYHNELPTMPNKSQAHGHDSGCSEWLLHDSIEYTCLEPVRHRRCMKMSLVYISPIQSLLTIALNLVKCINLLWTKRNEFNLTVDNTASELLYVSYQISNGTHKNFRTGVIRKCQKSSVRFEKIQF